MTSIAFSLGVVPLVLASGAGANARRSIGITTLTGMISSTCLTAIFLCNPAVLRGTPQEASHDCVSAVSEVTGCAYAGNEGDYNRAVAQILRPFERLEQALEKQGRGPYSTMRAARCALVDTAYRAVINWMPTRAAAIARPRRIDVCFSRQELECLTFLRSADPVLQ
jgi:hypothetical protein